jgi:hypothetical protein
MAMDTAMLNAVANSHSIEGSNGNKKPVSAHPGAVMTNASVTANRAAPLMSNTVSQKTAMLLNKSSEAVRLKRAMEARRLTDSNTGSFR